MSIALLEAEGTISEDSLYEIVDGKKVEVPPMSVLANKLASMLCYVMNAFAMPKKLGPTFTEVLFNFGPGRQQRRLDVAFVSWHRHQDAPKPGGDPPAWEVVPNLAVEVVSPTNTAEEIEERVFEFFDAGVELVWVIYPRKQRIHIFENMTQARILQASDTLEGGSVLPGFQIKIADLFALLEPTQ